VDELGRFGQINS